LDQQGEDANQVTSGIPILEESVKSSERPVTFNGLLLESLESVLRSILGSKACDAILTHLETNCSISRRDIPRNIDLIFDVLQENFGRGAMTIGNAMVRNLYEKLGWSFTEVGGFDFHDYLEAARARFRRETRLEEQKG
jgi:hypothetical protein